MFGGLPGCLLTTDDIAPAGREKILFQFGLTAQLLQTPIAAVMGMAAPVKVTVSLEGPVSQAGLDQVLPWGSGAHRGSKTSVFMLTRYMHQFCCRLWVW